MNEQQAAGSRNTEASDKVSSGPAHADAVTHTQEDLSETQEEFSEAQEYLSETEERSSSSSPSRRYRSRTPPSVARERAYWAKKKELESFLGFEPSVEPDQDELNAEITQGHWRCHLKRIVKIDHGRWSRAEYYCDRRPLGASWNGVALSRPFASEEESTYPSNHEGLHNLTESSAGEAKSSPGIDKNVESIYHLYRTIHLSSVPRTAEVWQSIEMEPSYHLLIKSPLIIELLQNIVLFWDPQKVNGKPIMVPEPYMVLWWHHRALRRYCEDSQSNEDTKKHLQVLINFLDSNITDAAEFKSADACNDVSGRITYRNAWYLYRPHAWLLCRRSSLALSWMSIVEHIEPAQIGIYRDNDKSMLVKYRFVKYNGSVFKWYSAVKKIKPGEWSGSLADAELVPIEYVEDQKELFANLKERGLRYWQLQGQNLKGLTRSETGETQEELDRVMVDEATYHQLEKARRVREAHCRKHHAQHWPGNAPTEEDESSSDSEPDKGIFTHKRSHADNKISQSRRFTLFPPAMLIAPGRRELISPGQLDPYLKESGFYEFRAVQAEAEPEEVVLMSCRPEVHGFSLRQKRWKDYTVNDLGDVHFRKDAFERLVLDESYKNILRRMIEHHAYQKENQFKDLVEGKGQGLIILLHGPPGVGKTLAAESIADLYQRPLYSVTSGDIGTEPDSAEISIRRIFKFSVKWKAIVLMDEADIFLAQRDTENVQRNALVSVFLRNLEYFDGIMVLTSNRVGVIDEAFQSRLDVALAFEPFNVNERKDVWYNFIEDLAPQVSEKEQVLLRREVDRVWSHKDLNGRQIRNCVKTASVLAKQHGENISARHIQTTIRTILKFSNDIRRVYKMDPERRAEKYGIRNHPKATEPAASSGRSDRKGVARTQRGRRSSSLEMEEDDDLGSGF